MSRFSKCSLFFSWSPPPKCLLSTRSACPRQSHHKDIEVNKSLNKKFPLPSRHFICHSYEYSPQHPVPTHNLYVALNSQYQIVAKLTVSLYCNGHVFGQHSG